VVQIKRCSRTDFFINPEFHEVVANSIGAEVSQRDRDLEATGWLLFDRRDGFGIVEAPFIGQGDRSGERCGTKSEGQATPKNIHFGGRLIVQV